MERVEALVVAPDVPSLVDHQPVDAGPPLAPEPRRAVHHRGGQDLLAVAVGFVFVALVSVIVAQGSQIAGLERTRVPVTRP